MATYPVDLDILNEYLLPDLGTIKLIPGLKVGSTEPSTIPSTVTVMGSAKLVASKKYRFSYNYFRFLRFGYILERNGKYEHGDFFITSKAVYKESVDPNNYTIPSIFFGQTTMYSEGSLGVTLGAMTDPDSLKSEPGFGITYQITNASPNVFPTLRMYMIKGLPLYEPKKKTTT